MSMSQGLYRLVGLDGSPHPVLDTPYESIDSAMWAAKNWCSRQSRNALDNEETIGIEVMTSNGSWRTVRYS